MHKSWVASGKFQNFDKQNTERLATCARILRLRSTEWVKVCKGGVRKTWSLCNAFLKVIPMMVHIFPHFYFNPCFAERKFSPLGKDKQRQIIQCKCMEHIASRNWVPNFLVLNMYVAYLDFILCWWVR